MDMRGNASLKNIKVQALRNIIIFSILSFVLGSYFGGRMQIYQLLIHLI